MTSVASVNYAPEQEWSAVWWQWSALEEEHEGCEEAYDSRQPSDHWRDDRRDSVSAELQTSDCTDAEHSASQTATQPHGTHITHSKYQQFPFWSTRINAHTAVISLFLQNNCYTVNCNTEYKLQCILNAAAWVVFWNWQIHPRTDPLLAPHSTGSMSLIGSSSSSVPVKYTSCTHGCRMPGQARQTCYHLLYIP